MQTHWVFFLFTCKYCGVKIEIKQQNSLSYNFICETFTDSISKPPTSKQHVHNMRGVYRIYSDISEILELNIYLNGIQWSDL